MGEIGTVDGNMLKSWRERLPDTRESQNNYLASGCREPDNRKSSESSESKSGNGVFDFHNIDVRDKKSD